MQDSYKIDQSLEEAKMALQKMKNLATGLFIVMAIVFIIAKIFEKQFHWVSYVRAFGEAAMVGALADWFAVTALFRHPLGLPIPHTAIIPKSKDRIGIGLGNFISRNFLRPEQVSRRLENIDLSKTIIDFLMNEEKKIKLSQSIASTIPRIFALLKDGPIMEWLENLAKEKFKNTDLANILANGLSLLIKNKRHIPIIDLIIFHADLALSKYEPKFRENVTKNTNWLPKLFSVDETAANSLLLSLRQSLEEAAKDKNHSLRNSIDEALIHFENNLRNDNELRQQIKSWQNEFSQNETISNFIRNIWSQIKQGLTNNYDSQKDNITNALTRGFGEIANALQDNIELSNSVNNKLKEWAVEIAAAQGDSVGKMVADTIKGWDVATVVTQIETAVGKDLQYIRINGTVIGGLVGLLIHIFSDLVF